MDTTAQIYMQMLHWVYRIKVFQETVWVERKPVGQQYFNFDNPNLCFDRADYNLYHDGIWNFGEIARIITDYQIETMKGVEDDKNPA